MGYFNYGDLSHAELVHAVIADSFEGIKADKTVTEQIRIGRNNAKQDEGFCAMLEMMHGFRFQILSGKYF